MPLDTYEMYDLLAHPEPYDEETEDEFKERQAALAVLELRMQEAGFTLNHLAGVLNPDIDIKRIHTETPKIETGVSPLMKKLILNAGII